MKIGIIQAISWIFIVRKEFNAAYIDEKITAKEVIEMYKNINEKIELPVSEKTRKIIDLVSELVDEIEEVVEDNKISINEIVNLAEVVCDKLGYDLDKEGFTLPEHSELEGEIS